MVSGSVPVTEVKKVKYIVRKGFTSVTYVEFRPEWLHLKWSGQILLKKMFINNSV